MVYVDNMKAKYRGMILCHLVADTLDELHLMADKIGVARKWFQDKSLPHYDICLSKKKLAIEYGAEIVDNKKMVSLIKFYKRSM